MLNGRLRSTQEPYWTIGGKKRSLNETKKNLNRSIGTVRGGRDFFLFQPLYLQSMHVLTECVLSEFISKSNFQTKNHFVWIDCTYSTSLGHHSFSSDISTEWGRGQFYPGLESYGWKFKTKFNANRDSAGVLGVPCWPSFRSIRRYNVYFIA